QPRHGGKIHRGRHTAHEVEDQQFHIKLVMDEAVSRHGELLSADGVTTISMYLLYRRNEKSTRGIFCPPKTQKRASAGRGAEGMVCQPQGAIAVLREIVMGVGQREEKRGGGSTGLLWSSWQFLFYQLPPASGEPFPNLL